MFVAMHMTSSLTFVVVVVAVIAMVALLSFSRNATCSALVHKALSSSLVIGYCHCCFVVVAIVQCNVLQNEACAPAHEGIVDDKCCRCCVVILVAIA
jgi:hypothetical protein